MDDTTNQEASGLPPSEEVAPATPPEKPRSGAGPLIGIVLIVALLAIGGLYFWFMQMNKPAPTPEPQTPVVTEEETPRGDEVLAELESQSESDDIGAIEADLEASNFDEVDGGSGEIDAELE